MSVTVDAVEKSIEILKWAIKNKSTLRAAGKHFKVSGTYVKDVRGKKNKKNHPKYNELIELHKQFGVRQIADLVEEKVNELVSDLEPEQKKFSESGDGSAAYEYKGSKMLTSLEEAIEFFKIDTNLWEVERFLCNSYPVSARRREQDLSWVDGVMSGKAVRKDEWTHTVNYQVKVWLKKRVEMHDAISFEDFFKESLKNHDPYKYKKVEYPKKTKEEKNLLEINIYDLHLGKLCWSEEVENNYDTKIASDRFNYVLHKLVERAMPFGFERILFTVGNDFFNSDGHLNQTTLGTRQDEDSRWQKTFKTGERLIIEAIDYLRNFAPVDVKVIPGNHDWTKSFFLGEVLCAWYKNDKSVTVDNSANPRKYYVYGNTLLGLTHGNNEKPEALRSLMAFEAKEYWANTTYKEWHVGHQHRKLSYTYVVKSNMIHEELGVNIRHMSSVAGTDAWHHTMNYVGPVRAAEAFLWSKESGLIGNFNVNIKLNEKYDKRI